MNAGNGEGYNKTISTTGTTVDGRTYEKTMTLPRRQEPTSEAGSGTTSSSAAPQ